MPSDSGSPVGAMKDRLWLWSERRSRWAVWGILSAAFVLVHFHRVAPTVIATQLMADLNLTATMLGVLAAVYLYVYGFMQIPSGAVTDWLGPRQTALAGILIAGIGSFLMATSSFWLPAFLARLLIGLGLATVFPAIAKVLARSFAPDRFATMSGLTTFIGGWGALLGTAPLALLATVAGWRSSFLLVAGLTLLIAALAWRIIPEWGTSSPARAGAQDRGTPAGKPSPFAGTAAILQNRYTWAVVVANFGLVGPFLALSGAWGGPFLEQAYGMTAREAAAILAAAVWGFLLGTLVSGYISDKLLRRRRLPIIAMSLVYTGSWLVLVLLPKGGSPPAALSPLFFLLGLTGSVFVINVAYGQEVNAPQVTATAVAIVNFSGFLSGALLQPGLGYLLDRQWLGEIQGNTRVYPPEAYQLVLIFCLFLVLVGLAAGFFTRETFCRNIHAALQPQPASSGE